MDESRLASNPLNQVEAGMDSTSGHMGHVSATYDATLYQNPDAHDSSRDCIPMEQVEKYHLRLRVSIVRHFPMTVNRS